MKKFMQISCIIMVLSGCGATPNDGVYYYNPNSAALLNYSGQMFNTNQYMYQPLNTTCVTHGNIVNCNRW